MSDQRFPDKSLVLLHMEPEDGEAHDEMAHVVETGYEGDGMYCVEVPEELRTNFGDEDGLREVHEKQMTLVTKSEEELMDDLADLLLEALYDDSSVLKTMSNKQVILQGLRLDNLWFLCVEDVADFAYGECGDGETRADYLAQCFPHTQAALASFF